MTCGLTQARIEARLTHELLVALSGAVRGDGEIMGSQDHRIIQVRRNHRRALVQPLTHSMTNYQVRPCCSGVSLKICIEKKKKKITLKFAFLHNTWVSLNSVSASSVMSGSLNTKGNRTLQCREGNDNQRRCTGQTDGEQGGGEIQFYNILFYKEAIKSIEEYLKKMSLHSAEGIN